MKLNSQQKRKLSRRDFLKLSALVTAVNELKTDLAATTAKLDTDHTTARDNVATLDNNYTSSNPVSFTTIVLSPRAGY